MYVLMASTFSLASNSFKEKYLLVSGDEDKLTDELKEKDLSDKKILVNKIQCKKCKDVIESKHVHDFKWCTCKSIAVDGGLEYLRRIGNLEDIIELSEFEMN